MAYRVTIAPRADTEELFKQLQREVPQVLQSIVRDGADIVTQYAKQNVSGVPFTSSTGTHTIQKHSGKLAASVQYQYPYGSPYVARIFASAMTRYANNPEEYDYAAILEYGRGEIKPKYTPSMERGNPSAARLAIPGGPHQLNNGQGGFRGVSGRYTLVSRIPPMEGKYWMLAAREAAAPDIESLANRRINQYLESKGL